MFLKDKFFSIDSYSHDDGSAVFHVSLIPDCDVYKGHFPGNPVAPGECLTEMIKECMETLTGKPLVIADIKRSRFTEVASPQKCPHLNVNLQYTVNGDSIQLLASLTDDKAQYMDFKGSLTEKAL